MNDYEEKEYVAIQKWQNKEPSVAAKAVGVVLQPLSWAITKIVPPKAIEGCLVAFDKIAEFLTDTEDVLRNAAVNNIEELQTKDLQLSDNLAKKVHNWALATAGVEGGATGSAGIFGMIVDIPALITMSLRVIHKIGVCYGFEVRTEQDHNFVFGILAAASSNTFKEKTTAVVLLKRINVLVAQNTWKKLTEMAATHKHGLAALVMSIKQLAKQLGINITKRKAAQAIPIIGAGVGAAINVAFLNDVSWAARRMYQQRWLLLNKKIDDTDSRVNS